MTLINETAVRFTDVENINKHINFFKYYNKKLIDPSKFSPKCWFNDLTNVTFHNSPHIVIATHINNLHTTQIFHIY